MLKEHLVSGHTPRVPWLKLILSFMLLIWAYDQWEVRLVFKYLTTLLIIVIKGLRFQFTEVMIPYH